MTKEDSGSRINLISTRWTVVRKALQGSTQDKRLAQEQVLACYGKAIRRYLLAAVRDPDAADELFQEFAQRLVEGKLGGASPARGRFRDFVKGVLSNLITDHRTRRAREATPRQLHDSVLQEPTCDDPSDSDFAECCRDELLARAWSALATIESQTGQLLHAALRLRTDQPDLRSQEMAATLSKRLGRPLTAVAVRQSLHRARELFADLLLEEVKQTLVDPSYPEVERELIDLRLLTYCHAALERRAAQG